MPNCKTFLVTAGERKHVRRRARVQQHRDANRHQVFIPSAKQGAEGNSRHSDGNIRGTCTVVRLDGQLYESSLSGLQKLGQRAKKFIELRGEYVE